MSLTKSLRNPTWETQQHSQQLSFTFWSDFLTLNKGPNFTPRLLITKKGSSPQSLVNVNIHKPPHWSLVIRASNNCSQWPSRFFGKRCLLPTNWSLINLPSDWINLYWTNLWKQEMTQNSSYTSLHFRSHKMDCITMRHNHRKWSPVLVLDQQNSYPHFSQWQSKRTPLMRLWFSKSLLNALWPSWSVLNMVIQPTN